jgi:bacterioferritin-associated ferredoxin
MYVCLCKAITARHVQEAGQAGVDTPHGLTQHFGLDDEECCGFCEHNIVRLVAIARGEDPLKWGKFKLHAEYTLIIDDPDAAP